MSDPERQRAAPRGKSALLVVDVQLDFCPGGALPARGGERILPTLNRHLEDAQARGMLVYASRDWHPEVTTHFQAHGGPWPPHCVQDSPGAQFHPDLALPSDAIVISKGDEPSRPGYSAFDGRTANGTALLDDLRARGIDRLYIAGIATDYCVKETVFDALRAGLRISVLRNAITGIDVNPGDTDRALDEMSAAGAEMASAVT